MNSDERLDDLNLDGLKIIQTKSGYGFTSDSVLLANFVKAKHKDVCVEIGTGSGVISVLVNYKENPQKIYAFEIQKDVADLASRNFELNNMHNKIETVCDKVQNYKKYLQEASVDVVFANPPYFKYDQNVCGQQEQKILSRFDKTLSLDDLFLCASKMLKFGGKMFFVYASSRMHECINTMKQFNLMPKRMYFVHPNKTKNSTVFLCEAVKGGKSELLILPPLFANNLNGDYIQTIQKLYKQNKK